MPKRSSTSPLESEGTAAHVDFAVAQEPDNPDYHERRGDALWGIERRDDARAAWIRALALAGSDVQRRRLEGKLARP